MTHPPAGRYQPNPENAHYSEQYTVIVWHQHSVHLSALLRPQRRVFPVTRNTCLSRAGSKDYRLCTGALHHIELDGNARRPQKSCIQVLLQT